MQEADHGYQAQRRPDQRAGDESTGEDHCSVKTQVCFVGGLLTSTTVLVKVTQNVNSCTPAVHCHTDNATCTDVLSQELHKYKENEKDTEVLMSALSAMQDKTQHLENSLSAETRIKLDLFSALGDAKRQLEIAQGPCSAWVQHLCNTASVPPISY